MIKICFENIEDELSATISIAEKRIFVAVAWFTNSRLYEGLSLAIERNVEVKILILDDILNRNEFGLDFGIITKLGGEVRFAKSDLGTMHNKFCIIDNSVITGSYNWTYHANKNCENILMTDEESIVSSYKEEFDRLFDDAIPIPQPYEYIKWTDVKEGDFSELRRNIFRDVIAKNDENRELIRIKLINLDHAYRSGDAEELAKASSLATEQHLRTITDVLTSRSQDFTYRLWEENIVGKPFDNVDGHAYIGKWWYVPYEIKEDKYHREYIEGTLVTGACRNDIFSSGLSLNIYDEQFIADIKKILCSKTLSMETIKYIPDSVLRIDLAKMFYYQFPLPMFNKSQPRTWKNTMPRIISAINLLGIVKETDGDRVVFYDGWDPQKRGEKIMKEFFSSVITDGKERTITDVLTSTKKRSVGELYYKMYWDWDEEPADVRFSTIDKWIFIPELIGESVNHEKYIRCYAYMYNRMKRTIGKKIKIDVYDVDFISSIDKYLQGSTDISRIPDRLICINFAKLSLFRLPSNSNSKDQVKHGNAIAVFCMAKEVNGDEIVYYEGWDPEARKETIIKKLR